MNEFEKPFHLEIRKLTRKDFLEIDAVAKRFPNQLKSYLKETSFGYKIKGVELDLEKLYQEFTEGQVGGSGELLS